MHMKKRHNLKPYNVGLFPTVDVPFAPNPDSEVNIVCAFNKRIAPVMPDRDHNILARLAVFVQGWLTANLAPLPSMENEDRKIF